MLCKKAQPLLFFCVHEVGCMRKRQLHIMSCHIIGIGVIDSSPAVFVGALDKEGRILLPAFLPGEPAFPVARGFQEQHPHIAGHFRTGNVQHPAERIRHIGGDMHFTQPDVPALALFGPVRGTHPGEART